MDPAMLAMLSPEELALVWEMPALDPPFGIEPNFENPGGEHGIAYAVIILGGVLATLSVLLRLISRVIIKRIDIEDGLFIAAFGLFGGFLYLVYDFAIWPGFRVHQWNLQLKSLPPFLKSSHISSIFYGLVIMLLKAAILLSWIRTFIPMNQRNAMFWISHVLIWSNVLFYGIGTIVEIFQCTPREKIWNPLYIGGHCPINMPMHMKASGAINLVSDIVILALPQWIIWRLHISRGQKIGLSLLFAIGIFTCACAAIRIYYLMKMLNSTDATYTGSELLFWMVAEMTGGFLIMGLPSGPKVVKSLPFTESMISLVRSIVTRSGSSEGHSNPRRGLPSWYKPQSRKRPDPNDLSELGTLHSQNGMMFLTTATVDSAMADSDEESRKEMDGITRKINVEIENS